MCRKAAIAIIGKRTAGVKGKTPDLVVLTSMTPLCCISATYRHRPMPGGVSASSISARSDGGVAPLAVRVSPVFEATYSL
jgi:hypothetical protein